MRITCVAVATFFSLILNFVLFIFLANTNFALTNTRAEINSLNEQLHRQQYEIAAIRKQAHPPEEEYIQNKPKEPPAPAKDPAEAQQERARLYRDVREDLVNYLEKELGIHLGIAPPNKSNTSTPTSAPLIPKLIHMTIKNKKSLPPRAQEIVKKWKTLNPNYTVIIYDDVDMAKMVKQNYPEFYNLYTSLYFDIERSDMWRYLVMHLHGGVYADFDWEPILPVDQWHLVSKIPVADESPPHVMIGIDSFENGNLMFAQYGLYSTPKHDIFYNVVKIIREEFIREIEGGSSGSKDAVQRTGALPFSYAVHDFIADSGGLLSDFDGYTCTRVDDVDIVGSDYWGTAKGSILAKHYYEGTWKSQDRYKIALAESKKLKEKLHKKQLKL